MEMTIAVTEAEREALKVAFPGNSVEEALAMMLRSELEARCRIQLKRARVVSLQALKRNRNAQV